MEEQTVVQEQIVVLNNRGVLSLPEDVQNALDLHPGSAFIVTVEDGAIVMRPVARELEREYEQRLARRDGVADLIRGRREDEEIFRLKFGW